MTGDHEEMAAARRLDGHVAVVTGAGRGLGRRIAEALAGAGAIVALVARSGDALEEVAAGIRASGGMAEPLAADVTSESALDGVARAVRDRLGTCDILVNNAGINIRKPLIEYSTREWDEMLAVNLSAPFALCRVFVPGMQGRRFGRILNLTSTMAHTSLPGRAVYSATKTGLLGLTRGLALELAPWNITVNGISPGPFATEMLQPVVDDAQTSREFLARIPLGRFGHPREVGRLAAYLCSEDAGFITGTDILIDGGWTAI